MTLKRYKLFYFKRFFSVFFCLIVFFTIIGCKEKVKSGEVEVKRQIVSGVTLKEVQTVMVEDYYEITGTVKSKNKSIISAKVMGVVTKINFKEGDFVRKGDILITIDDSEAMQRLLSAQKSLESVRHNKMLAQTTYQRYKRLYDEKAISGQELDQIETQKRLAELEYDRLDAMYKEAQIQHSNFRITAPQDGIVSSKKIDLGSMAIIGQPLISIDSVGSYYVESAIDESMLSKIRQGMDVSMYIESTGRTIKAKITEIIPIVDPSTRTFLIKIGLSGDSIKSGQFVKVRIPVGNKEVILIPEDIVVRKGQLIGVYTVDSNDIITYRLIKLGKKQGSMIEVLSGLQPREKIVVDGLNKVIDGGKISR